MKLVEVGEKLSSKDIKEMEGELNLSFPKDYKDFLLKTNGGMPEDEVEFDLRTELPTRMSLSRAVIYTISMMTTR